MSFWGWVGQKNSSVRVGRVLDGGLLWDGVGGTGEISAWSVVFSFVLGVGGVIWNHMGPPMWFGTSKLCH